MNKHLLIGLDLQDAREFLKNEKFEGLIRVVQYGKGVTLGASRNRITLFLNGKGFISDAWIE